MKLKYYLRGLGIGMVVTALLMGFATKNANQMSDEEIKARAKELGMVEQLTLADVRDNAEQSEGLKETPIPQETEVPEPTEVPQITEVPEPTEVPQITEQPQATEVPENTEAPENTEQPIQTDTPATTVPSATAEPQATEDVSTVDKEVSLPTTEVLGDIVHITIYEGNNSVNVSRALEEAGLVENASTFDRYLRNNGYSKIINTGVYKIALGTSEAEIARIITNTD
ncbi:MAG: hypothetical protein IJX63_07350 [Lachnospiraceae bacterium]|nr:hypothetical protein [Lachnospiraceae bacterium]